MGRGFCVDENSGVVYALQMEYGKDRGIAQKSVTEIPQKGEKSGK